jgi:hypothetical protein
LNQNAIEQYNEITITLLFFDMKYMKYGQKRGTNNKNGYNFLGKQIKKRR